MFHGCFMVFSLYFNGSNEIQLFPAVLNPCFGLGCIFQIVSKSTMTGAFTGTTCLFVERKHIYHIWSLKQFKSRIRRNHFGPPKDLPPLRPRTGIHEPDGRLRLWRGHDGLEDVQRPRVFLWGDDNNMALTWRIKVFWGKQQHMMGVVMGQWMYWNILNMLAVCHCAWLHWPVFFQGQCLRCFLIQTLEMLGDFGPCPRHLRNGDAWALCYDDQIWTNCMHCPTSSRLTAS